MHKHTSKTLENCFRAARAMMGPERKPRQRRITYSPKEAFDTAVLHLTFVADIGGPRFTALMKELGGCGPGSNYEFKALSRMDDLNRRMAILDLLVAAGQDDFEHKQISTNLDYTMEEEKYLDDYSIKTWISTDRTGEKTGEAKCPICGREDFRKAARNLSDQIAKRMAEGYVLHHMQEDHRIKTRPTEAVNQKTEE